MRLATVLVSLTGMVVPSGAAQSQGSDSVARPTAALDVPYLPQSVLLCGGAALAMVERWWGRRGVYAEDFADLVKPALGGIRTTDLDSAARARGWDTQVLRRTPELVRENVLHGVPVIALIQVAPERYHYVVVVGWSTGRIVYHDPAGSPFTTIAEALFLTRWNAADGWALLVQPAAEAVLVAAATRRDPAPADPLPCSPWLDLAVDAALARRLEQAEHWLATAREACPGEPRVLRELAGVRFKQGGHSEVVRLATEYVTLVPGDGFGWQLLATGRFQTGDRDGALDAWNQVGRPSVDLVRIDGTRAIRFRKIADAVSVDHGAVLTSSGLALARRRLSEVPALRLSAVEYQPVPGGIVELRVAVIERPMVDRAWRLVAAGAIRAVAQHEAGIAIASPTGAGELWTGTLRWEYARSKAALRVDLPAALGFPGVVGVEGARERFRFLLRTADTTEYSESLRSAVIGYGGWVTAGVRPSATLRLERWSEEREYLAASVGVELRARENRLGVDIGGGYAFPLSSHGGYTRGGARASWASSRGLSRTSWSTRIGFDWARGDAPLGVWPAAGSNFAWAIPLRAHPLSQGGLLAGASAGRGIMHAGLSGEQPIHRLGPLVLAVGVFLDAARVMDAADASEEDRFYLDGGAGLRIGIGDGQLGVLRIDLARGLVADRHTALSLGVHRSWPP